MQAFVYSETGAARDVLHRIEKPLPSPGSGEVRVQVFASGINPSDTKRRSGNLPQPFAIEDVTPHSDAAGLIDAIGAGVEGYKVGDRVWLHTAQWKTPVGAAADYVVVPATNLAQLPANISFAEGATFGVPLLTAWRAIDLGGDLKGKTVLVTGGAGAVGNYAIQLAKAKGARVIATISSEHKAGLARSAGADETINYRTENVVERVSALTKGNGVDHYVEVNMDVNISVLADILAMDASVAVYGSDVPQVVIPNLFAFFGKRARFDFFIVYDLDHATIARAKAELAALLQDASVEPNIDQTFAFVDIAKAHDAVEAGANGNVILIHQEEK